MLCEPDTLLDRPPDLRKGAPIGRSPIRSQRASMNSECGQTREVARPSRRVALSAGIRCSCLDGQRRSAGAIAACRKEDGLGRGGEVQLLAPADRGRNLNFDRGQDALARGAADRAVVVVTGTAIA